MSQTTELSKVKARIKALTEKTVSNGCTEAEAMAAAEMVGRLLERYALTMEEVDVRAAACVQVAIPLGGQRRRPIDGCVTAIARFCECKVWLAKNADGASYVFFGCEPDTALAGYLFSLIDHAIRNELAVFRARHPALKGTHLRTASTSLAIPCRTISAFRTALVSAGFNSAALSKSSAARSHLCSVLP